MNERVNELIKSIPDLKYDASTGMFETDRRALYDFAELIIRECVSILMTPEYPMNHPEELADYNRGWVNGRQLGIEHIREQFGVEE